MLTSFFWRLRNKNGVQTIRHFSDQTAKHLGHYVYALIDPANRRNDQSGIFYIGKGQGQRCFDHAALAEKTVDFSMSEKGVDLKHETIRKIQRLGQSPIVQIVAHRLPDAATALQIESILIQAFELTNKQAGHQSQEYWLTANELEERYGTPVKRSAIPGTILLVSLNKSYPEAKRDPTKLKNVTLGNWTPSHDKALKVDYVIGVYGGLMVSFYRTKKDEAGKANISETNLRTRKPNERRRFRWEGDHAPDLAEKFMNRALFSDNPVDPESKELTKLPSGAPLRFIPEVANS